MLELGADINAKDSCGNTTLERAILDRKNWQEKSQNAIELIKGEFLWDKIAVDTVEKYKEII